MRRREFVGATAVVGYARALALRFELSYDELLPERYCAYARYAVVPEIRICP
jgi:hypothetical protein